jgi:hypothetical protein
VFLGLVHGVRELARDALEEAPRAQLSELVSDIVLWITATIRGASAAADELGELEGVKRAASRR